MTKKAIAFARAPHSQALCLRSFQLVSSICFAFASRTASPASRKASSAWVTSASMLETVPREIGTCEHVREDLLAGASGDLGRPGQGGPEGNEPRPERRAGDLLGDRSRAGAASDTRSRAEGPSLRAGRACGSSPRVPVGRRASARWGPSEVAWAPPEGSSRRGGASYTPSAAEGGSVGAGPLEGGL